MLLDLPRDVLERVVDAVADSNASSCRWHPLLAVSCVSRELRVMVRPSAWQLAWQRMRREVPRAGREALHAPPDATCRELVHMCASRRCMGCGQRSPPAKAYWCFGVRACRACLNARTLGGEALMRRQFVLTKPPWKYLRCMNAKTLRERRYWCEDVHRVLHAHFGARTLEEYDERLAAARDARAREVARHVNHCAAVAWPHADLQVSATFQKLVNAAQLPPHVVTFAPRILREVAEERARRLAEARRRENCAERRRLMDVAVAAAALAWEEHDDDARDVPCPRCRSGRRFTQKGLVDHFCDVHAGRQQTRAATKSIRIERRAAEYQHPLVPSKHQRWSI
jgi:hypothetical protein